MQALARQQQGATASFDRWSGRGGPAVYGGQAWPPYPPSPWGDQSWGFMGWPGENGHLSASSFPAFGSSETPGENHPDPTTASASASTARAPTATSASPGRLDPPGPDPPQGEGNDDPWLEAARGLVNSAVRQPGRNFATAMNAPPEIPQAPQPPELPRPLAHGWGIPAGHQPPAPNVNHPGSATTWMPGPATGGWNQLQPPTWTPPMGLPWNAADGSTGPPGAWKGDFTDPPAWPGWQYRRQWVTAVRRWNKFTDIPLGRRSERVLRTLGWEMMSDFEHISEAQLASGGRRSKSRVPWSAARELQEEGRVFGPVC